MCNIEMLGMGMGLGTRLGMSCMDAEYGNRSWLGSFDVVMCSKVSTGCVHKVTVPYFQKGSYRSLSLATFPCPYKV